jgi:hypothetical protein
MSKGRVFAAVAAAIAFVFISQTVSAQYPPPDGSLICTISRSRVDVFSNVTLTVRLIDTFGNVRPGQRVDFVIVRSNGSATLSNSYGITDSNGQTSTTVFVGALTGTIEVAATAPGVGCHALIDPIPPTPTPTPAPTQTPVTVVIRQSSSVVQGPIAQVAGVSISPPQTGDGGLKDASSARGSTGLYLVIALELLVLVVWVAAGRMQGAQTK